MAANDYSNEDIDNAPIYDSEAKKTHCPQCGEVATKKKFLFRCSDESCDWREYMRNKVTGEKVYED